MNISRFLLISTTLLLCSTSNVRAVAGEGEVIVLLCDIKLQRGLIAPNYESALNLVESSSQTRQEINVSKLIEYSPQDDRGNARRLKSKITKSTCGPFEIEFSAGWFNSNPMGASGSDDFGVIRIFKNGKKLLGPISLSGCLENCGSSVKIGWGNKSSEDHFEVSRD
jgi:hypothetical protein